MWLLMLQKELAQRLSAAPASADYGALTLQIQLHHRVEYLRAVPASVFLPRPEVDSALVRISPRAANELPAVDTELFNKLVRQGFSQRRKQLGKLIADFLPDWPRAAENLGLDRQVRAEAVSLPQWIALTNYVGPVAAPERQIVESEMFPVVDESDNVLGAAPRSQVHGDNLRHRAVHVLIFNKKGEILLQKRSRWKDRHPLLWDSSAAGHVGAGEEYDHAAQRELQEELGFEVPLERMAKLPATDRTDQEFIWIYHGRYDGDVKTDSSEIDAIEFFPAEIIDGWITARPENFATAFLECWKIYSKECRSSINRP